MTQPKTDTSEVGNGFRFTGYKEPSDITVIMWSIAHGHSFTWPNARGHMHQIYKQAHVPALAASAEGSDIPPRDMDEYTFRCAVIDQLIHENECAGMPPDQCVCPWRHVIDVATKIYLQARPKRSAMPAKPVDAGEPTTKTLRELFGQLGLAEYTRKVDAENNDPPTQHYEKEASALCAEVMEELDHIDTAFTTLTASLAEANLTKYKTLELEPQEVIARLELLDDLIEQCKCPECGCYDDDSACAADCGCDAPACSVVPPETLAQAYARIHGELTAERQRAEAAEHVMRENASEMEELQARLDEVASMALAAQQQRDEEQKRADTWMTTANRFDIERQDLAGRVEKLQTQLTIAKKAADEYQAEYNNYKQQRDEARAALPHLVAALDQYDIAGLSASRAISENLKGFAGDVKALNACYNASHRARQRATAALAAPDGEGAKS